MAILTKRAWKRHSNPWSAWTRILSYPLVYLPFWNRSWKQGAAEAAWFSLNPLLFPEPKEQQSWATPLVWLTDMGGLSREEAVEVMRSNARTLLRSALEREAGPL